MDKRKFEKEYFSGYYKKGTGSFGERDIKKSMNWFYGWFKALEKYVDFNQGEGRRVLEIGCSIAGASNILDERGFEVHSADISKYAVSRAKKLAESLGRKISFYAFDVQEKIAVPGKFDIIFAFEVIEHLENPLQALKNMRSKLKEGGTVVCSTPNDHPHLYNDPTHINVKNDKEWIKVFKKAGFKKIFLYQVSFLPFFYRLSQGFHIIIKKPIYSKYINSPLFIIGLT